MCLQDWFCVGSAADIPVQCFSVPPPTASELNIWSLMTQKHTAAASTSVISAAVPAAGSPVLPDHVRSP